MVMWLLFFGCGGTESVEVEPTNKVELKVEEQAVVDTVDIEKYAIDVKAGEHQVLAPSPEETRLAVERAGITTVLSQLIPDRSLSLEEQDSDHTALRVGIILSDSILLIHELPKEGLVSNLHFIRDGFTQMGAGAGLVETINEYAVRIENEAMTRDDLIIGLEQIASMSVPDEGFGKDDRSGPMLQAGAWTAGVALVSQAIIKEKRVDLSDTLLRHGPTADYFLSYVRSGGQSKAATPILNQLENSLILLKEIAEKDQILMDDVIKINTETTKLLGMI